MDPSRELLEAAAREVFADTPVLAAYLYGSRARGDRRPDSDVDIAVLLGTRPDSGQAVELSLRSADHLERLIHLPVDTVLVLDTAPLRLAGRSFWTASCSSVVMTVRGRPMSRCCAVRHRTTRSRPAGSTR